VVSIHYAMKTRVTPWRDAKRVALYHGPWLLGINKAANSFYFETSDVNSRFLIGKGAQDSLKLTPSLVRNKRAFAVPVAQFQVKYLPGSYPCQPQEATLCPAAEQTGMATTAWDFLFNQEDAA
jgi:hypothetical protein